MINLLQVFAHQLFIFTVKIGAYLQVLILTLALGKRLGRNVLHGFVAALKKTILATLFMALVAAAMLALTKNLPAGSKFDIVRLAAVVPPAATAYWLAARILRIEMLSLFTGSSLGDPGEHQQ